MKIDLKSKSFKDFSKRISQLKVLIVDPGSGLSKGVRPLLNLWQIRPTQIETVASFADALTALHSAKPELLISEFQIEKENAIELIQAHSNLCSLLPFHVRIIALDRETPEVLTKVMDCQEIDHFFTRPFSVQSLQESILPILYQKFSPSEFSKAIQAGRSEMARHNYERALLSFALAKSFEGDQALALFYSGMCAKMLKNTSQAQRYFYQGLDVEADHYGCLKELFDLNLNNGYTHEAYEIGIKLVRISCLPPERIPDLIRLTLKAGQFDDLIELQQTIQAQASEDPEIDARLRVTLAAGLITAGRQLGKGAPNDKAVDLVKRAFTLGRARARLQLEAILSLIQMDSMTEANALLLQASPEVRDSLEISIATFERAVRTASSSECLQLAMSLQKQGKLFTRLFEVLLEKSIETGRRADVIESLFDEACRLFPEQRSVFLQIVQARNSQSSAA